MDTSVHARAETGADTVRLLYSIDRVPNRRHKVELVDGTEWVVDPFPSQSLVAVEGNPGDGSLWTGDELLERADVVAGHVDDHFGVRDFRGVSRLDATTSRPFDPARGRAFMAGLAALGLPRLEATRRGSPVHSVWWTGTRTATIRNRAYCESFKVEGRQPFERVRLEDQRRYKSGARPTLEAASDPVYVREQFERRWAPMREAATDVRAASLPVLAQAIADEVRYGYRSFADAERLAGSLVLLAGGITGPELGRDTADRRRYQRRKRELHEAGYVVVDDFMEPVEVDLGDELDRALAEFGT